MFETAGKVFGNDGGELKAGAKTRFVPARETSGARRSLRTASEHDLLFVRRLFLIPGVEKSLALRVDFAAEFERELVLARRQFVRQGQRQRLLRGVKRDRLFRERLIVERGGGNFHLERVEHEFRDRFLHV